MLSTLNACTYAHSRTQFQPYPHRGLTFSLSPSPSLAGVQLWQKQGRFGSQSILVAGGVAAPRARVNAFTIDFYSILSWRDVLGFVHAAENHSQSHYWAWIIKREEEDISEGAFRDSEEKNISFYYPHRPWYCAWHAIFSNKRGGFLAALYTERLDFDTLYHSVRKLLPLMLNACSLALIVWFMFETDYLVEWL